MIAVLAALSSALAIAAGAFGAHGAASPQAAEWLRTGGLYQLIHAVGALAIMGVARGPAALHLGGAADVRPDATSATASTDAPKILAGRDKWRCMTEPDRKSTRLNSSH